MCARSRRSVCCAWRRDRRVDRDVAVGGVFYRGWVSVLGEERGGDTLGSAPALGPHSVTCLRGFRRGRGMRRSGAGMGRGGRGRFRRSAGGGLFLGRLARVEERGEGGRTIVKYANPDLLHGDCVPGGG